MSVLGAAQLAPIAQPHAQSGQHKPIRIFVAGCKGYVWDPDEVLRLRRDCRLMGMLLGGITQYKNQNIINGLPLELNADEVTLALDKGWATLHPMTLDASDPAIASTSGQADAGPRRRGGRVSEREFDEHINGSCGEAYFSYYKAMGAYESGRDVAAMMRLEEEQMWQALFRNLQDADTSSNTALGGPEDGSAAVQAGEAAYSVLYKDVHMEPAWKDAVAEGSTFVLPVTADEAKRIAGAGLCSECSSFDWPYPSTPKERLRYVVFSHLHSNGYTMSGGAKFGADMLAYPGDPSLYHAQFTVRLMLPGKPINPMLLKAAARGSHAARKHLLLATVPRLLDEGANLKELLPAFISIAPESGFGSRA